MLTQLSKQPRDLPTLELEKISLYEAIERPAEEVAHILNYSPHIWKTNSKMAA